MKLYIVTLTSYHEIGDTIVKVFSDKETLDRWITSADQMEKELFGANVDPTTPISKKYRIKEAEVDNLDWIELYASAKNLGASVKSSQPQ